ncbi:uncharacterized protein [Spinacia oleracea]|uniref:Uncharacterized protein n=1 Tax=Spinacia oleracea TaxID=3562 RepID=A0ABM3RJK0_SPIOL|nr:uncharacterized protein LOC110793369 [Spinacia oleracea]
MKLFIAILSIFLVLVSSFVHPSMANAIKPTTKLGGQAHTDIPVSTTDSNLDCGSKCGVRCSKAGHEGCADCGSKCGVRCSKSGHDRCMRFCQICCEKCNCVPSGTYGNKHECPCYRDMRNSKGNPKCP